MNIFKDNNTAILIQAILCLKNDEECKALLEDILTEGEILAVSQRLEVARLLRKGTNYSAIAQTTGASTATISRVNRCVLYGTGGYETIFSRIDLEE
ncbi:YerC/YecD family TrpR-related protein [Lacrimispora sp.]|uniref:YerC/YecD family TrpR-related protein n=1 Tax=Lacrimispora sp. TaxID=2719234 RepID=UPI00289DF565|nr:YerC/YecD family TrpR-related protein [Lacrimispora sp.]